MAPKKPEDMETEMRLLDKKVDKILFILQGDDDVEGLLQKQKSMWDMVNDMTNTVAHLVRFKKRIEESQLLEKQAEKAERIRQQQIADDSRKAVFNKVMGIAGLAIVIIEFVWKIVMQK